MTIDDLKALEGVAAKSPWEVWPYEARIVAKDGSMTIYDEGDHSIDDARFIVMMRNLAPHLIALWEACMSDKFTVGDGYESLEGVDNAINTLNAELSKL